MAESQPVGGPGNGPERKAISPNTIVGSAESPPALPPLVSSTFHSLSEHTSGPTTMRVPGRTPSDEFFKNAVLAAGIPVAAMDPTGLINVWNLAAVRLFGRAEADMLGRPLETAIPADFRPAAGKAFQRTLQQRSTNQYEMSFVPIGGKHPVHVGVTLSVVADSRGEVRGVIAWMRDISNRKELESNLQRTRHMASLGTLAAGVAHQFNNIVCGMSAMVDYALTSEDSAAMIKALRMSAEAASRISYITQSLMACSPLDDAQPDLSDLTEELLRFADAVEPTLQKKGIKLHLDLQASRVASVPRARFGQMLQHLLRNAEESFVNHPAGQEKKITLRTLSQEDQFMLQFCDTGCGIDPDHLPQIFDPFFTTKGVQGGGCGGNPGLGLTIVHGVVVDMGGHVWADSAPGKGTTIHILIPIAT